MNAIGLEGVHFRPAIFEPTFQKHAKATCGGVQIHVTDRHVFEPVKAGVALMRECNEMAPKQFAWRPPPYEYEYGKIPIDILAGSTALREQIAERMPLSDIVASWSEGEAAFARLRAPYLLY
jgi:uncharacterized protein YbbC (DUF1343 family)